MNTDLPELLIVMPVFNEQASVRKVAMEWFQEVENWTERFVFLAIDDGSTDGTPGVLARLKEQLGERFEIVSRSNKGHGQTCLEGYRVALKRQIPWVFQIDSDGQCDPQYFFRFWRMREHYDVVYGQRFWREDGWRRIVASEVLRITLMLCCLVKCVDANVPYRMMRTSILGEALDTIPADFNLANIALAVLLRKKKGLREGRVKIRFRERYGGEPSVALGKFGAKAGELIAQLKRL